MRRLILVLALFALLNVAWGFTPVVNQETSSSSKSVHNGEEYTKIIKENFDLGADAESITQNDMDSKVRSFLSKNIPRFEIDPENLVLSSSYIAQKSKDLSILKYIQTYNGLPVYSSRVIIAVQDGKMVTLKSDYHPKIDVSTKPALSEPDTLEAVEKDVGVPIKKVGGKLQTFNIDDLQTRKSENVTEKNAIESVDVEKVSLVIYPKHTSAEIEYSLAYKVELGLIESPPAKWVYIVDANNGEILEKFNKIVFSTLSGGVTGPVYPENPKQSLNVKGFEYETLYGSPVSTPSNVFWSGKGNNIYNYIMTKNRISLSGASSATLEFKTKYSIESCSTCDFGYVGLSPDGQNLIIVGKYSGNLSTWETKKIDISGGVGNQYYLVFLYDTDGSVAYDGWYIEDIKVTTNAGTIFSDTSDSFANWDNIGFSVVQQDFFSYPVLGTTGADGSYSISGLDSSVNLNSWLEGPFVDVYNKSGADAYHTVTITTPNTHNWDWSNDDTSYKKEQSNVYYHANRVHDFFTKGSPFDIYSMNYRTIAYVQYPGTCNAFADGTNIHFYGAGGGCEATSLFSDIIYHEYTHNVVAQVYTTTLPYWAESGALNEGWADYFAGTINGNPCMDDIEGADCGRNMTNTYRYPEDIEGEVHYDSRIVSGAAWDIRQMVSAGVSDALVINAMKLEPFNFTEYLEDIIVADDNNSNLADGTPHLFEICTAFYQNHGIYSSYCYTYYPVEPTVNLIENPGFESGLVNWHNSSGGQHSIITDEYSDYTHQGSWFAYMGDYNNSKDYIYQDITIPSNANEAYVRFWYWILSQETTTTTAKDRMKIEIRRPDNNTLLKYLGNLSNLNESYGFVISSNYDVSEFKGQTIRLKFNTTTDASGLTAFFVDDTALMVASSPTGAPALVFAITPNSRNAQIGTPVTLFMSVINYGTATANDVSITQASSLPSTVSYQQWDGTAFTGSPDTPVNIAAGSTANFVITIDATSVFDSSSLTFNVSGTNVAAAPISAVNTLTISSSATPSADVIMMSTSLDVSIAVNTPTVFAVATSNVGGASATGVSLVLSVPSTITGLAYQLNETNPDGSIKGPATGSAIPVIAKTVCR